MKPINVIILLTILSAAFLVGGCSDNSKSTATIGKKTWTLDLAITDTKKFQGLSGRMTIQPDEGMLFIEPKPVIMRFCMRDCYVPIDIIFIDANKKVVNTYAMRVETNKKGSVSYSSEVPAKYALEVAGGTVKQLGIKIGDPVTLKIANTK